MPESTGRPSNRLILLCVCTGLGFLLQQVVIGHGWGVDLSLGSMLLRGFALCTALWMLWHHGVPAALRRPALAIGLCMIALAVSTGLSGHRDLAMRFAPRYALELLLLWSLLNLSLAFPTFAQAAGRASLIILWLGLFLSLAVHLDLPGAHWLAMQFYPQETLDQYSPRACGLYQHPALFGATAVMTLAMILFLYTRRQCGKAALALATTGCLLALLVCGSRNPLLGLLVTGAAAFWHYRKHRAARLLATLLGGIIATLLGITVISRYAELTSAMDAGGFTAFSLGRPLIWAAAFKAWLSEPLFGLGAGVFQFLIPDFADGRFLRGELHAHNVLLGLLSELGLFGASAFIVLGVVVWQPWLNHHARGRAWAATFALSLLSFGVFDYYQPFYGFALHGCVMAGLLYGSYVRTAPANVRQSIYG